jgi:hypothetical protein
MRSSHRQKQRAIQEQRKSRLRHEKASAKSSSQRTLAACARRTRGEKASAKSSSQRTLAACARRTRGEKTSAKSSAQRTRATCAQRTRGEKASAPDSLRRQRFALPRPLFFVWTPSTVALKRARLGGWLAP